jgi:DnaK suppressor protein
MTDMAIRSTELRDILSKRRREIQDHVQGHIRGGRADRPTGVADDLEHSDADIQEDLEITLLQMRAETLTRIDEALVRLDAGKYGSCFECDGEIPEQRLRALPFAVRCQACEERYEHEQRRGRQMSERRAGLPLFPDVVSS